MRTSTDDFHQTLATLGLSMPNSSAIVRHFRIATEFLDDHAASPDDTATKWLNKDFLAWYRAMLAVETACSTVVKLKGHPAPVLIELLSSGFAHSEDVLRTAQPGLFRRAVSLYFVTLLGNARRNEAYPA
jgi:hypothetical protein